MAFQNQKRNTWPAPIFNFRNHSLFTCFISLTDTLIRISGHPEHISSTSVFHNIFVFLVLTFPPCSQNTVKKVCRVFSHETPRFNYSRLFILIKYDQKSVHMPQYSNYHEQGGALLSQCCLLLVRIGQTSAVPTHKRLSQCCTHHSIERTVIAKL